MATILRLKKITDQSASFLVSSHVRISLVQSAYTDCICHLLTVGPALKSESFLMTKPIWLFYFLPFSKAKTRHKRTKLTYDKASSNAVIKRLHFAGFYIYSTFE